MKSHGGPAFLQISPPSRDPCQRRLDRQDPRVLNFKFSFHSWMLARRTKTRKVGVPRKIDVQKRMSELVDPYDTNSFVYLHLNIVLCIYKITCCQAKWLSLSLFLFSFFSLSLSLSLSIHAYLVEKDWGAEGLFMQFSQHTPTLPRDRSIPPDSIICAPPKRAQMHAKLA